MVIKSKFNLYVGMIALKKRKVGQMYKIAHERTTPIKIQKREDLMHQTLSHKNIITKY